MLFGVCLSILFVSSCRSIKHFAYLQNIDSVDFYDSNLLYDARIMPKDFLTITVNTMTPEAAVPFSLYNGQGAGMMQGEAENRKYLVDNDGYINFPVVGKIHVVDMTVNQCQDAILEKIRPYLADEERPIVTVRLSNFTVTVIGEVGSPQMVQVTNEKMNVFQALASAGDLSLYGKRTNVTLVREDSKGRVTTHKLNLNDANIINSPYYYLQQNDMIYVEPMKIKATNSYASVWLTSLGMVTGVAALLISILKK